VGIAPSLYTRREAASVLIAVIAVTVALSLVVTPLNQVADPVRKTFGIDDVRFSYLLGALSAVPSLIMTIVGGWLADRVSRRTLLMGAMLVWVAGGVWSALAPDYWQLATARVVVAMATGIKFPLIMAWLTDAYPPDRRGRAIGAVFVVIGVGPALGALLSGLVIGAAQKGAFSMLPFLGALEPWRIAVLGLALSNLFVVPWLALLRDARQTDRGESPGGAVDQRERVERSQPLWIVAIVMLVSALLTLADNANLAWLPTVLSRQHGFDAGQVGFTFGLIVTLAGCLGPLIGGTVDGWIYRRHRTPGRLLVCAIAAGLCVPLLANFLGSDARLLVVALIGSGILTMLTMTLNFLAMQSLLPADHRGLGVGLSQAMCNLAAASAPTAVALVSAEWSNTAASALGRGVATVTMLAFGATALCSAVAAWVLNNQEVRLSGEPHAAGPLN
jgi:predicted MFS family arabinose efflux permease